MFEFTGLRGFLRRTGGMNNLIILGMEHHSELNWQQIKTHAATSAG